MISSKPERFTILNHEFTCWPVVSSLLDTSMRRFRPRQANDEQFSMQAFCTDAPMSPSLEKVKSHVMQWSLDSIVKAILKIL
jgi:hypothetical protein